MNTHSARAAKPLAKTGQPIDEAGHLPFEQQRQVPMLSVDDLMKVVDVIAERHGNDAALDLILKCL